jgi:hypothetical protein
MIRTWIASGNLFERLCFATKPELQKNDLAELRLIALQRIGKPVQSPRQIIWVDVSPFYDLKLPGRLQERSRNRP